MPTPRREETTSSENDNDRASPRQLSYLQLLSRRAKGWGLAELEKFVKGRFGSANLYEIGRGDASMLIEEFKAMTPNQGARR